MGSKGVVDVNSLTRRKPRIITDPYQIPLFSLCNISTIAASTFYQEKIWYSSVIIIDNYFGQTAILDILQLASGFALSSFSEALS